MSLPVSKGADINTRHGKQDTLWHCAILAADPRRVKRLLEAGVDRSVVDVCGLTQGNGSETRDYYRDQSLLSSTRDRTIASR